MKKEERQRRIAQYIEEYTAENRCPPTIREIRKYVEVKSTATVFGDLAEMARRGEIGHVNNRFVPNYTESYMELIEHFAERD